MNVEPYINASPKIERWHTSEQAKDAYTYIPAGSLPPLGAEATEARIKLFDPTGGWTWYLSEYDPVERLAFGLVVGQAVELGYVSLDELADLRGRFGLPIERDLSFQPTDLAALRAQHER